MTAKVTYSTGDGNTVPYPPLFDDIRQNYGFINTVGHPERVDDIPEAEQSDSLRSLLLDLASLNSKFASLGCDLGESKESKRKLSTRWVAGGYVQIMAHDRDNQGVPALRPLSKAIEENVTKCSGKDRWEVEMVLVPTFLKLEDDEIQSIWIWFHARASTLGRAQKSRERLLVSLRNAIRIYEIDQKAKE